ncbi:hypothetical protein K435DRAFT_798629 [Dendrothele bispora CBS 962.96]|uniref:Uncharacterized protein n=1 Tax=Dendrothele bispora (strain CBS 962.96) TaxID=1314807 RepID=A0A4V4HFF9_DENBC|nr:hypothetical protein K435DRAFT_798629 [Dendrothele bispora CBS 962.96]
MFSLWNRSLSRGKRRKQGQRTSYQSKEPVRSHCVHRVKLDVRRLSPSANLESFPVLVHVFHVYPEARSREKTTQAHKLCTATQWRMHEPGSFAISIRSSSIGSVITRTKSSIQTGIEKGVICAASVLEFNLDLERSKLVEEDEAERRRLEEDVEAERKRPLAETESDFLRFAPSLFSSSRSEEDEKAEGELLFVDEVKSFWAGVAGVAGIGVTARLGSSNLSIYFLLELRFILFVHNSIIPMIMRTMKPSTRPVTSSWWALFASDSGESEDEDEPKIEEVDRDEEALHTKLYFGSAKVQTLFDTSVTQVYVTATQISRLGEICVAVT